MIEFNIGNNVYQLPQSWSEVNLEKYMKLERLLANIKKYKIERLVDIMALEILSGADEREIEYLNREQTNTLLKELQFIKDLPEEPMKYVITIDDKVYCFPKSYNALTNGEEISIVSFMQDVKEPIEAFDKMLAVLLLPATEVVNPVTGVKEWKRELFDRMNIEYIEDRAELFRKRLMVTDFIGALGFFFNGVNQSE